jgi:hypothetical protein
MDETQIRQALEAFDQQLALHEDHTWQQTGRCVYCADCGERLYQGYLPAERRKPKKAPPEPAATTEMRERWHKT